MSAPARPRSRLRRLAVGLLASAAVTAALFLAGELAVRWHVEGGAGPAVRSLFGAAQGSSALRDRDADHSFLPDDELGYVLNPEQPGINSLGVRHAELEATKPADVYRVIVVGDSIAWAPGGFADRLGQELTAPNGKRIELINASVPGYTTYQERLFVERTLAALEPDLVLLQYCLNDNHKFLHRINQHGDRLFTPEAKRALLPEGDGLLARFASWSYLVVEVRRRLYARQIQSDSPYPWEGREDFSTAWKASTWPLQEEQLRAMQLALAPCGAELAVIAVPYEPQLANETLARDREYVLFPQRQLAAICERLGLPYLDLFDTLKPEAESGLYTDGIHLTERGHELATRAVVEWWARQD